MSTSTEQADLETVKIKLADKMKVLTSVENAYTLDSWEFRSLFVGGDRLKPEDQRRKLTLADLESDYLALFKEMQSLMKTLKNYKYYQEHPDAWAAFEAEAFESYGDYRRKHYALRLQEFPKNTAEDLKLDDLIIEMPGHGGKPGVQPQYFDLNKISITPLLDRTPALKPKTR